MADRHASFTVMVELLSRSSLPLSIRSDHETQPSQEEVQTARAVVSHVMTDNDVRSRLTAIKVEPLVRASAILLADGRRRSDSAKVVASAVLEFLDVLAGAYGAVPSVLNNRGVARLMMGDNHRALADFDAARRLAPAFIAPRVNELEIYQRLSDHARLEQACDDILRVDPKNMGALRARLDARTKARKSNPSVLEAARALYESGGASAGDLLLLGSLSMKLDDPTGASKYFEEFVKLDPNSVEGHQYLGGSYLNSGEYEKAVQAYERVKELDGPKTEHLLALGAIYDQIDRVDEALQAYQTALESAPEEEREVVTVTLEEFKERRSLGPQAPAEGSAPGGAPGEPTTPEPVPDEPASAEPPSAEPAAAKPPSAEPAAAVPAAAEPAAVEEAPEAPRPVAPTPFPDEEELPGVPGAGDEPVEFDVSGDAFGPKVIGDVELAGMVTEELPIDEAPQAPEATEPEAPGETAAEPPAEAAAGEAAEPMSVEAVAEAVPEEPVEPAEPARPLDSEELAAAMEAATSGWEEPEPSAAPAAETGGADAVEPAPPAPAQAAREPPVGPVVSAPPPPVEQEPEEPEELGEDLVRELEAVSGALAEGDEVTDEGEPFRRPTFNVDEFMADLESKTAATFDHLYDGMLEARRKEAAEGAGAEPAPTTPYVSAPPIEGLQGMAVGAAGPPPGEAPAPDDRQLEPAHSFAPYAEGAAAPPIPLLLKEQAARAVTHPRIAPAPRRAPEPVQPAPRPAAPPFDGQIDKARELADAGVDAGAMELVEEYLASFPDDARAWNLRGDLRERADDPEDALNSYRNAVKYDPTLKEAWNNLGVLLHLVGRFGDAAEALESGTRVDPKDRHLWHNLGSTYHELGRLKDAIRAFDRAVSIDPHDKVSHNNKGTTLYELGDFVGARSSFQRAIEVDPEFEQAQNNLGRVLERLGYADEAAEAYKRALKLNPQSRTAAQNLARLTRGGTGAKPRA